MFGIAQHFVLFSTNDEAGDAILDGVGAGFTLLGPDTDVLACQEEAYVLVDACIAEQSRCEPAMRTLPFDTTIGVELQVVENG